MLKKKYATILLTCFC